MYELKTFSFLILFERVNQKISEVAQKLWDADVNRFKPNEDYELDLQSKY